MIPAWTPNRFQRGSYAKNTRGCRQGGLRYYSAPTVRIRYSKQYSYCTPTALQRFSCGTIVLLRYSYGTPTVLQARHQAGHHRLKSNSLSIDLSI